METMTLPQTSEKIKYAEESKLSREAHSIIRHINFILELIIINTLQFNKLISAEEIYEKLILDYSEHERENLIDINIIENICQELCNNNGVLIKLRKNNIWLYKLNHKNYM
jgi:hypothetical protein